MSFETWTEIELAQIETGTFLRKPSRHQSMFKYIGLDSPRSWSLLESTLNSHELVGATCASLNDPFEVSPSVFDDLRPSTIAQAIDFADKSVFDENAPPLSTQLGDILMYRNLAEDYLARVRRYSRIVAFCERSDSPLLWSHYADSYRGACLHFLGGGVKSLHAKIGYVTYAPHRPIYPLSLALALTKTQWRPALRSQSLRQAESDKLMFFSKASDWAYETEIRAVYNVNSVHCIEFDPESLVSIIIGPRMSKEYKARLVEMVSKSKVPHLVVREATLSRNAFSVQISWDECAPGTCLI